MQTIRFYFVVLALMLALTQGLKLNRLFMSRQRRMILEADQQGRVTMYKKKNCPYCIKALETLEGKYGLHVTQVDIDGERREEILMQMRQFSGGRNTVPQVFFNEEHIGGNEDVQILDAEGTLMDKVEMVMSNAAMMQEGWFHPWY